MTNSEVRHTITLESNKDALINMDSKINEDHLHTANCARKVTRATNNFIKEYSVTIGPGETFGYERTTYRHGGIYTHQITNVKKDTPLDRAVNFMTVLYKEIVSVNGIYIKSFNDFKVTRILNALRERGGTVVFGILDDTKAEITETFKNDENAVKIDGLETEPREETMDSSFEESVEQEDDVPLVENEQARANEIKEYCIRRMGREELGICIRPNLIGKSYKITQVTEGGIAAKSVNPSLLLNREIICVNGIYVKSMTYKDFIAFVRNQVGDLAIGVLDRPVEDNLSSFDLLCVMFFCLLFIGLGYYIGASCK